jgi:hypothetical protein
MRVLPPFSILNEFLAQKNKKLLRKKEVIYIFIYVITFSYIVEYRSKADKFGCQ